MRLNEEQQRLVEENHNLIYKFLIDKKLPQDDFYGIAAIGLCNAALKYNPDAGYEFSTYAYKAMMNTVQYYGIQTKRHNVEAYSANNLCTSDDDADEFLTLFESNDNVEKEVATITHFEWFVENMSNRQLQICICKYYNLTDREIGKLYGVTHSRISDMWRTIKKHFMSNTRPNSYVYTKHKDDVEERMRLKNKLLDIVHQVV